MPKGACGGFSLIEICIVLGIIAIVTASGMTIFSNSLQERQLKDTQKKMQAIQDALLNYRSVFNRIPCPADVTQAISATPTNYFGTEAATPGTCTGGTPAANFSTVVTLSGNTTSGSTTVTMASTTGVAVGQGVSGNGIPGGNTVVSFVANTSVTLATAATATASGVSLTFVDEVEGMVPTKTLRLPDDYAFDGYGRRIMYAVDARFTATNAFTSIPASNIGTRMTVLDQSDNPKTTTAAYVLVSFGPDGFGAYPPVADRHA